MPRLLPQQGASIWNRLLRTRSAQPRKMRTGFWRVQSKKRPFVPSSGLGGGWGVGWGGRNVPGVTVICSDGRAPVQHSFKARFVHLCLLPCAWGRRSTGQSLLINTEICSFATQVGSGGAFLQRRACWEMAAVHHVQGKRSVKKTEKSLKRGILDLIISREAEHCEMYARRGGGEPSYPTSAGWYVCFNYSFCGNTPPGQAPNHAAAPSIPTHLVNAAPR